MVVKVGRAKPQAPVACLIPLGKRLTVTHPAPLTWRGSLTAPFTISVFLLAFSREVENLAGRC